MGRWFGRVREAVVDEAAVERAWEARMARLAEVRREEKSAMERVWDEVAVAKMGAAVRAAHEVVCYGVD